MSDLFDQITSYKQNHSCMAELADACNLDGTAAACDAYGLSIPIVLKGLSEAVGSRSRRQVLIESIGRLSWAERNVPAALFRANERGTGSEVVKHLFGTSTPHVISQLAKEASISNSDSKILLEITGVVTVAALCSTADEDPSAKISTDTILSVDEEIGSAAVTTSPLTPVRNAVYLPEPEKRSHVSGLATPPSGSPLSIDGDTFPQAERSSNKKLLLAPVLVLLLALLGVGEFLLSNGEGETASESAPPDSKQPEATTAIKDPLPEVTEIDEVKLSVPMSDITGTTPEASGVLKFNFNTETGEVCYSVESDKIEGPYRSHIHVGGPEEKGGIVVDLGSLEDGSVGCVSNLPVDTEAILNDRGGHYAELHDLSEEWTIRGQLSEATQIDGPSTVVDTDGGGAEIVLDGGTLYLRGDVPDRATADEIAASLDGIGSDTPVVDELRVASGAPLPSGRVVIADTVFFDADSDDIKQIDEQTLSSITALAESRGDWDLMVVGHTDSEGSDVYNLELSLRRASTLRDLLSKQGIPDENLRVRGAGETAAIGDNQTEAGRAQNRRIEFEFTPKG